MCAETRGSFWRSRHSALGPAPSQVRDTLKHSGRHFAQSLYLYVALKLLGKLRESCQGAIVDVNGARKKGKCRCWRVAARWSEWLRAYRGEETCSSIRSGSARWREKKNTQRDWGYVLLVRTKLHHTVLHHQLLKSGTFLHQRDVTKSSCCETSLLK